MPYALTDAEITIVKNLLKNGRISFRQISRETGITVKSKYDRLVNIGFIKSVSHIFNFEKVSYRNSTELHDIKRQSQLETEKIDADNIRRLGS